MAFNWLAPATVCMLLAWQSSNRKTNYAAPARHDPAVTMMLSNRSSVAYLTGG